MAQINLEKFSKTKNIALRTALDKPMNAYAKQEYATPLFVLRETLTAFMRHNVFGMSASLSFYALFALIPLVLLIFFLLSHLVFSSDFAIVKLAILTGNLVPEFSSRIMVEVYSATQTKAAWGALGLFVLLWAVTPLASSMRSTFYTIASMVEVPSFFKRKLKDVVSVLGILLLFFLFTSAGFIVEKSIRFFATHFAVLQLNIIGSRKVTDFDGTEMSEKELAAKYGVHFTPTFQFFGESPASLRTLPPAKREVARAPGYLRPGDFLAMFRFVREKAYETKSFRDFVKALPS